MYEELAPYYDELFPASEASVAFLLQYCKVRARVLDVACGVGAHAVKVAAVGNEVIGIDLDARMIDLANERAAEGRTVFLQADMVDLAKSLSGYERFDLAYCLGNSVVHLSSVAEIRHFVESVAEVLTGNGIFVTQMINFDCISAGRIPELNPLQSSDGRITFTRRYEASTNGEAIRFLTELTVDDKIINSDSIPMVPVTSSELETIYQSGGFGDVSTFADFSGNRFSSDSFMTIVVGKKTGR